MCDVHLNKHKMITFHFFRLFRSCCFIWVLLSINKLIYPIFTVFLMIVIIEGNLTRKTFYGLTNLNQTIYSKNRNFYLKENCFFIPNHKIFKEPNPRKFDLIEIRSSSINFSMWNCGQILISSKGGIILTNEFGGI